MPSQEYIECWQEANEWLTNNAPDFVLRLTWEWHNATMKALPAVLALRGVDFAGEPVEGSVRELIEAALAVNATLLDLGAANLLEGHQEERAERLCNATAAFTLADAGEGQTDGSK